MRLRQIIPLIVIVALYPLWTPLAKPRPGPIEIPQGHGVSQIGEDLRRGAVVNSSMGFGLAVRVLGVGAKLKAGRYSFKESLPVWQVAERIASGNFGTQRIKLTVPEGYTNAQIGELIGQKIDDKDQGYLFPDTYYIDEFSSPEEIRSLMTANFALKAGGTSHQELIVASILEKEVQEKEDMRLVAGILYKRLDLGMPLQVDAVPSTYEHRGLPEFPISNPGLKAIEAAKNPTKSPYLYYLSGKDGLTHFAKTFEEHKLNKSRYLR